MKMKTNTPNRTRVHARLSTLFTALVLACVAIPATIVTADHKEGKDRGNGNAKKGGNGGGPGFLARAHFFESYPNEDPQPQNIVADDLTLLCEGDNYWNYWAPDDSYCGGAPAENEYAVVKSDISTGGRWIFSTGNGVQLNPAVGEW